MRAAAGRDFLPGVSVWAFALAFGGLPVWAKAGPAVNPIASTAKVAARSELATRGWLNGSMRYPPDHD
jgi:hypothetical protein